MSKYPKSKRLRNKADIDFVFAKPKKLVTKHFVLLYRGNSIENSRLGIIIAKKKVPKAHDRNRFKRIVREAFRTSNDLANVDIIFLARQSLAKVENSTLRSNLEAELRSCICLDNS